MSRTEHLHLFAAYGIELEYMLVDRQSLKVRPISDLLLIEANGGALTNEVEFADMAWSNELVMHVIEMKTNGPTTDLKTLGKRFQTEVDRINTLAGKHGAMLMPTAMHPLMDPEHDTKLWPHDSREIYDSYNRIFDCRGHGWSNLQSVHINFPFFDAGVGGEFGTLHAAIRLVLPILPALAASSPLFAGKPSGVMDSRLDFYRGNQRRIPSITGGVIPEQAFTRAEYDEMIFQKIYADIKPHDPEGLLQDEWLNSRGAIARFDRNAIEIRLLDIQESPLADQAVVTLVIGAVKALAAGHWVEGAKQREWTQEPLRKIFDVCLTGGSEAMIEDRDYLDLFHYPGKSPARARDLWKHILERLSRLDEVPLAEVEAPLENYMKNGCLSRRILEATGARPTRAAIEETYRALAKCLADGGLFSA